MYDLWRYLMHNIETKVSPQRKVPNPIAQRQAPITQPTFQTVIKHIYYIPLHLKLLRRILCNEQATLQTFNFLSVEEADIKLYHLG